MEQKDKGLKLLKKGHSKIVRAIFSRMGLIFMLMIVQIALIAGFFAGFKNYLPHFVGINTAFSFAMVLVLLNSRSDPTFKITWLIVIAILPVFGALLYAYTQSDLGHRALKSRINDISAKTSGALKSCKRAETLLKDRDSGAAALAKYIGKAGCHPLFCNTDATYIESGAKKLRLLLCELEKAEKYIFLEYFIISKGYMWDKIIDVLKRKAACGVEVRVMYDGTCEFTHLPHSFPAELKKLGIRCKIFAPITPFLSTHYNYRDHRKIAVIDGKVAFTGGINLADEYININSPYGDWKDAGVMIKGSAASSFTFMFLQMWNLDEKCNDFEKYLNVDVQNTFSNTEGFVVPYSDSPLDGFKVGENVYADILNRAKESVSIMTPYLILDGVMENAIKFASERGVEVNIILPGIPDKKAPYALAKTHYVSLLESGVNIYEYTPGFIHAKVFCADGKEAVVGTVNLDYRSLYHHFECATYLYGCDCIEDIEKDFENTLKKCRIVTYDSIKKEKLSTKITGFLLKAVAPLL